MVCCPNGRSSLVSVIGWEFEFGTESAFSSHNDVMIDAKRTDRDDQCGRREDGGRHKGRQCDVLLSLTGKGVRCSPLASVHLSAAFFFRQV